MEFVVSYEMCSMVFLAVIMFRYFRQRRFPSLQNKFFSFFVIIGMADLLLDVTTAYTIETPFLVPGWLNMILNSLLYICRIGLPSILFIYLTCLTGELRRARMVPIVVALAPVFALELMIFVNPFNGMYFSFDSAGLYVRGPWFNVLHIVAFVYMLFSLGYLFVRRKRLLPTQFNTLIIATSCLILLVAIQFFNREYLLVGMGITIMVVMMYLTLQDPSSVLDATTDLFTGEMFWRHYEDSRRRDKCLRLVFVGISDMRQLNMIYGFETGTKLICAVADYLKTISGHGGLCFRLKGDQLAVVVNNDSECRRIARDIHSRFLNNWQVGLLTIPVNAVVCCVPNDSLKAVSYRSLPVVFDSLLRTPTPEGSSLFTEVNSSVVARLNRVVEVESAIHAGVENDGFEVHFQPIYSLAARRFVAAEALVRFYYEGLGHISPGEFIELAEKNQLISRIGEQVIDKVCRFIKETDGLRTVGLEHILVNLSPVELLQEGLSERILKATARYDVDPSKLLFEITETAATTAFDVARKRMDELAEHNIRFALDDFGTGYANIDTIVRLPFHIVKLDHEMLINAIYEHNIRIVLEDILRMIDRLGLHAIVEGLENEEMNLLAEELGIDFVQGYYYARPMPKDKLIGFLANQAFTSNSATHAGL